MALLELAQRLLGLRQVVLSWSAKLMVEYRSRSKRIVAAAVVVASLGLAGLAHAQTTGANAAGANGAYARAQQQERDTADAVRDANGQSVATDGVTQAGEDQSGFAHDGADGSLDIASGVGASGAATAFGDNLNVVTRGPAAGAATTQTNINSAGVNQAQGGGASNDQ